MVYSRINWTNDVGTKLNAANLNVMDKGISDVTAVAQIIRVVVDPTAIGGDATAQFNNPDLPYETLEALLNDLPTNAAAVIYLRNDVSISSTYEISFDGANLVFVSWGLSADATNKLTLGANSLFKINSGSTITLTCDTQLDGYNIKIGSNSVFQIGRKITGSFLDANNSTVYSGVNSVVGVSVENAIVINGAGSAFQVGESDILFTGTTVIQLQTNTAMSLGVQNLNINGVPFTPTTFTGLFSGFKVNSAGTNVYNVVASYDIPVIGLV